MAEQPNFMRMMNLVRCVLHKKTCKVFDFFDVFGCLFFEGFKNTLEINGVNNNIMSHF